MALVLSGPAVGAAGIDIGSAADTDPSPRHVVYRPGGDGHSIETVRAGPPSETLARCGLVAEVQFTKLSADRKAIIISGSSFVTVEGVRQCARLTPKVFEIPAAGGMLEDVHVGTRRYIGLVPVGLQPLSFLAVVATLGSTRNLVSLPGSFRKGASRSAELRAGFVYGGFESPSARFSIDGRYVTPSGDLDCDALAYPGVWDLQTRRRVVLSGTADEVARACVALFD